MNDNTKQNNLHTTPFPKKVGLMGGTFDPIHKGHLELGKKAMESFGLDEVWFMPTGISYLKKDRHVSDAIQRFEMTELSIEGYKGFKATDIELQNQGYTYTCETMVELSRLYPDIHFFFIMGQDSLLYFDKWYHPDIILKHCSVLAATREGSDLTEIQEKAQEIMSTLGGEIFVFQFDDIPISSTKIREAIRHQYFENHPMKKQDYLFLQQYVAPQTLNYILEHELYREDRD